MNAKSLFSQLLVAAFLIASPAIAATTNPSVLAGFHHVPAYTSHILDIDIQNKPGANGGSYAIKTTDSVPVVAAWYKRHLPDQTSETVTADGHHLFYTKNGSTVDVSKAIPFDGNYTIIGVVAAK